MSSGDSQNSWCYPRSFVKSGWMPAEVRIEAESDTPDPVGFKTKRVLETNSFAEEFVLPQRSALPPGFTNIFCKS